MRFEQEVPARADVTVVGGNVPAVASCQDVSHDPTVYSELPVTRIATDTVATVATAW